MSKIYYWDILSLNDIVGIQSDTPQESKERLMLMLDTLYDLNVGWHDLVWRGDYNLGYVRCKYDWQ